MSNIPNNFVNYFKNYPSLQLVNSFLDTLKLFFGHTELKPQHQNWATNLIATQTEKGSHFVFQLIFNNKEIFRQEIVKGKIKTQLLLLKEELQDIEELELLELNKMLVVEEIQHNQQSFFVAKTKEQWLASIDAIQQHYRKIKRQQHQELFYELATTPPTQLFSERKALFKELELFQQYKSILKQNIQSFVKIKEIQTIITTEVFYFEKAQAALKKIKAFEANKNFYQKFLERYQNFEGQYSQFVASLSKRSKQATWATLLGEFLAYVDEKTAKQSAWNSYPNKRYFSASNIRQQSWIQNLTQFKIDQKINSTAIKAALAYIENPTKQPAILAMEHCKLIAQNLFHQPFKNNSLFLAELLTYFNSYKELETTNSSNQTYLITRLLYLPTIVELWKFTDEDTYQGELMDKIVAEPLPQYYLAQSDVPLNQILYGPPGTGKTYRSIRQAIAIVEQKTLATLQKEAQITLQKRFEDYLEQGQIVFTTFHQAMSYEDFVEGIKPLTKNGRVVYEIQNGLFKQIAQRALDHSDNNYVLVIDEINRGNIANILGELITLLEADKRLNQPNQISIQLPYSKTMLNLPSNLYIVGTMNTTDRSTEMLDAALRRRFVFVETSPKYSLLAENIEEINLQQLLLAINKRITALLDKTYVIGHAYFMYVNDLEELNKVFANQILPLLEDYFYNDYGKIGLVLGKSFVRWGEDTNSVFADFNYQGMDRFWEQKTYQLRSLPLPKEAYLSIYN